MAQQLFPAQKHLQQTSVTEPPPNVLAAAVFPVIKQVPASYRALPFPHFLTQEISGYGNITSFTDTERRWNIHLQCRLSCNTSSF